MPKFDEAQFDAENDVRSLIEAEEIRKDPKRMRRAIKEARKKRAALNKVVKK